MRDAMTDRCVFSFRGVSTHGFEKGAATTSLTLTDLEFLHVIYRRTLLYLARVEYLDRSALSLLQL